MKDKIFDDMLDRLTKVNQESMQLLTEKHHLLAVIFDMYRLSTEYMVQREAKRVLEEYLDCPECNGKWDIENNRCKSNCQTLKEVV